MRRVVTTHGYSLVELLIVLAIAGLIGGAILGVYRVSQDTYIRASSLEAAQVGARAGLDRMANELRLIGSFWVGANGAGNAITAASQSAITFQADVDADTLNAAGNEITLTADAGGGTNTITVNRITGRSGGNAFIVGESVYIANSGTRDVRQITNIVGNTLTLATNLSTTYPAGSFVRDVKTITYARNANATSTCPALTCLTRTQGGGGAQPIVDNVTGLTFTYFNSAGGR
ncbi:MAG: prepilin-type N-terminal cleavage/methylation domain-containing protein [Candidatus Methylomirabilis sp.]|nr:prepilin-type N-terminal cleavage/methylation domain-containing protein [Candidatus Methylomirabilis sp.]